MSQDIKQKWNLLGILNTTSEYFKKLKFENPRLNAEILLCHAIKLNRVDLYLQFDRILKTDEINAYRELVRRRAKHEPLQYIIGETEFMGLSFLTTPAALIPRPETELLVQQTLKMKKNWIAQRVHIWDIGTGSGCIAVSLAKYWQESLIFATDISQDALDLAKSNAENFLVAEKIRLYKHDIFSDPFPFDEKIDIVVSNPPYISKTELNEIDDEIKNYEPIVALTDNNNGIRFYERILSLIGRGIKCKFSFLELSGTQSEKIIAMSKTFGFKSIDIINDLNEIPRVLKIEI